MYYHPDFTNGCPAYFDVSIRNTLQSSISNQAAMHTTAGVAAADGEANKDNKYVAMVERAGAVFVPLAVETLGV